MECESVKSLVLICGVKENRCASVTRQQKRSRGHSENIWFSPPSGFVLSCKHRRWNLRGSSSRLVVLVLVCVGVCLWVECSLLTVHRVSWLTVQVPGRSPFTSPPAALEELLSSWLRAEGETKVTTGQFCRNTLVEMINSLTDVCVNVFISNQPEVGKQRFYFTLFHIKVI